jgi:hypothetical protein
MSTWFILITMVFLHIIDDYCLQASCLNNLKQKSWWEQNAPGKLYENDYIWALMMHGFSWAFMIMLPIAIYRGFNVDVNFFIMLLINTAFHAGIDDLKANKYCINLWTDQLYHIGQIFSTLALFTLGVF